MLPRLLLGVLLALPLTIQADEIPYVLTPRDTAPPPPAVETFKELAPEYELLTESDILALYYRRDRGVLALLDLRNGYLWKAGLDIAFSRDLDDLVDEGADPLSLPPVEERLNTTYTGISNSIVFIEYYDGAANIKRVGSAARSDVVSRLSVRSRDPFLADLAVEFEEPDIFLSLELRLDGDTLEFSLPATGVTGAGAHTLASVGFAPFLGASGGRQLWWDPQEEDWEISRPREPIPGYVVVPDGSGALIRFEDNSTELSEYIGDVYGEDISQSALYQEYDDFSVPPRATLMPMYGVVHGRSQNAFLSYATSGAEYMEVVAFPEDNTTFYNWAYPRFIYNRLYYQVYNQKGDGYFRVLEEPNRFDVELRYQFLADDGDSAATPDYVGIARAYRQHLEQSSGLPQQRSDDAIDIPLRIDFLMADVRESIIGTTHEVTTTIAQVDEIVLDLESSGISNLSVGLLGYARGGTVLSRPGTVRLLPSLGRTGQFIRTVQGMRSRGVDVSLSRDYAMLADGQLTLWRNAVRGASGWYNELITFEANAPVNLFYYARPLRVSDWLLREAEEMESLGVGSLSIDGIGSTLLSDYSGNEVSSVSEVKTLYAGTLSQLRGGFEINMRQPNQYFWPYVDRFLDTPMFSTQYLLQTDTVPLLQMVLAGSMDMFGPYSNFSFYSDDDVLRLIDYNVYPSFLVTAESAHLLLMTNSSEFYSTEYSIYRDLILSVYDRVNRVLREVRGASWLDREVVAPGVVVNRYDNGVRIVINYTERSITLFETAIPAGEARVVPARSAEAP